MKTQKSDQEFYQELNKQELSEQEVFEAKQNFTGFFDLLLEIDNRNKLKEKSNDQNQRSADLSDQAG